MPSASHQNASLNRSYRIRACSRSRAGVLRAADDVVQVRHPELRVVHVALELAQRERQRGERPVLVRDRVAGVLPALVVVAVGRAGLVLLEPVPVAITGTVDPADRPLGAIEVAPDDRLVAEPVVEVRQHAHVERRRVVGAVVGRERQHARLGELAVADLVRDLARLHVPHRVVGGRLERAQPPQRPVRELRVAADRLHRDDERVAAEQRDEPRDAGRGHHDAALERRVLEPQRLEVRDRPGPRPLDVPVRGVERRRRAAG